MHEFHLMKDLLKKIEHIAQQNKADKVTKVDVWLGALSHITPGHFREHFEEATVDTIAADAKLNIESSSDIHHPQAQEILLRTIDVA